MRRGGGSFPPAGGVQDPRLGHPHPSALIPQEPHRPGGGTGVPPWSELHLGGWKSQLQNVHHMSPCGTCQRNTHMRTLTYTRAHVYTNMHLCTHANEHTCAGAHPMFLRGVHLSAQEGRAEGLVRRPPENDCGGPLREGPWAGQRRQRGFKGAVTLCNATSF